MKNLTFKNSTFKVKFQLFRLLLIILFFSSCHKWEEDVHLLLPGTERFVERTTNDDFNYSQLEIQDKLKYAVARLTARNLDKPEFLQFLLSSMQSRNEEGTELFYLNIKNQQIANGKTIEQLLVEEINLSDNKEQEWATLLSNTVNILPTIVFTLPYWTESIIQESGGFSEISSDEISVWPCMSKNFNSIQNLPYWFGYRNNERLSFGIYTQPIFDHIPIQVKESERYVLVSGVSGNTWYGRGIDDLFLNTADPSLMDMLISNFISYTGHILTGYSQDFRLIDVLNLQTYINKYLTPESGDPQSLPACKKICNRDCVEEKNYIDGFKFTNGAVYGAINNQPGGENLITLVMQFLTAQMCGNLSLPETCAANTWFRTIRTETARAFKQVTVILHENEIAASIPETAYLIYKKKLVPWLKYYRLTYVDTSCVKIGDLSGGNKLYFLDQGGSTEWNGNIYGSNMLVSVHEHDEVVTQQTTVNTEQRAVTTKVSLNIVPPGDIYKGNYEFSNSVTRTTTNTLNFIAEKDVKLGDFGLHYCNKPNFACLTSQQGVSNTGSVLFYVAFE